MKKLLYFTTILFNIVGIIMSLSLAITLGIKYENFIPVIFISCMLFIVSLSVTIIELNKETKNNIIYLQKFRKPTLTLATKGKIIDYHDYFSRKKGDFIIA